MTNGDLSTPPQPPTDAAAAASPGKPAPALSHIRSDRPCVRCGFNLLGQAVTREPEYGLLIARCPECGQAAALDDYPRWTSWRRRVWLGVAAIALAFGALLLTATSGMNFGLGRTVPEVWRNEIAREISADYTEHVRQLSFAEVAALPPPLPFEQLGSLTGHSSVDPAAVGERLFDFDEPGAWVPFVDEPSLAAGEPWADIDSAWWRDEGRQAAEEAWSSRVAGCFGSVFLLTWGVVGFGAGCLWGVLLAGLRGWRLLAAGIFLGAFGLAFALLGHYVSTSGFQNAPLNTQTSFRATELAERVVPIWVTAAAGSLVAAATVIGMFAGRPIIRIVLAAMLPPRVRTPFSYLWEADGKALPTPSRNSAKRTACRQ